MSQLTVTRAGLQATASANDNGFKISITHFKVGTPAPGFTVSAADSGQFLSTNDGMEKDTDGTSFVVHQGEVSLVQVLADGSVQFHLHVPLGIPAVGQTWNLSEVGLYLESGELFARGPLIPTYPKQSEYGVEIRAIVVLTSLCDVINVTVGTNVNLPSTIVRNLEPPKQSQHNAILVYDQHNNQDVTTSASLALQYGPGNKSWGYIGYTRVYAGLAKFDSTTQFKLNPSLNGFWLLDRELCIVHIMTDTLDGVQSAGEGYSRRMRYNVAGHTFTELDGKPFQIDPAQATPEIAIWRDPAWMLSRATGNADFEIKAQEFDGRPGDTVFEIDGTVTSTTIVHINEVYQNDSYYIDESGSFLCLRDPLETACKVSLKWFDYIEGAPTRAIKFKRAYFEPNGSQVYSLPAYIQAPSTTEDQDPLIYANSVFQTTPQYDPVLRTLDLVSPEPSTPGRWVEAVFFEREVRHGYPVLQKFVYPSGQRKYVSPLSIQSKDHILVYVGNVYQRTPAFEILDDNTVQLASLDPDGTTVTLVVSGTVGARRNVPLMDEYVKLREYVFCKLGRPDDRHFDIGRYLSSSQSITLPEQLEDENHALLVVARNVLQTDSYTIDPTRTVVSFQDPVAPEGMQVVQILDRTYERSMYSVHRVTYPVPQGVRYFALPKICRNRENLLVLLGQVIQTDSFSIVDRGRAILFDSDPPGGILLTIVQPHNESAVNGPFLFKDNSFVSVGTNSFKLKEELDNPESALVFVGRVLQKDSYTIGSDLKSITFDELVPRGMDVLVKHLHHRCFQAQVDF